jgi:hypothetical protein
MHLPVYRVLARALNHRHVYNGLRLLTALLLIDSYISLFSNNLEPSTCTLYLAQQQQIWA